MSFPAIPGSIDGEKHALLADIVARLAADVRGVRAVVLGGSFATGKQRTDSDIDVAIYYSEAQALEIDDVRTVAREVSSDGAPTVSGLYGWGPWVNGGAWINTWAGRVDFLYRNIEQVQRTIADAHAGVIHHDYGQQPTFGFYSAIYLGETHVCVPLHDPDGLLADLKARVAEYPKKMKAKIIADSLGQAEFTLLICRGHAHRGDVYNTVGCLARAFGAMTQAVYAVNETYFMSDKAVARDIPAFPSVPTDYYQRFCDALAIGGGSADELAHRVTLANGLWQELVHLSDGYSPRFQL